MSIEAFPVVLSGEPPQEERANGRRCSSRVWFADWHEAMRGAVKHGAQDIMAPSGSLVLAPESGDVVGSSATTGTTPKGGHWLRIATRERVYYMSHLRDVPLVVVGDVVVAGQQVGVVGRTGNAARTCPHLHIGCRKRRTPTATTWTAGQPINIFRELREALTREAVPFASAPSPEAGGSSSSSETKS
jgi:murein DD-endopeptidase MepM/ murein hydrolase activator NlpD